jgi:hypothetical protein
MLFLQVAKTSITRTYHVEENKFEMRYYIT